MAAGGIHLDLGGLVGAKQSEADQENVQQARVVGILDVFEHQLPVGRDELARVAEKGQLAAVEDPVVESEHRGSKILFERLQIRGEGRENHAVAPRYLEFSEPMVLRIEISGHAALLLHPAAKGYADQVPL